MKPVRILHPTTGQHCFTKHPGRVMEKARNQVTMRHGVLIVDDDELGFAIHVADRWRFPHTVWTRGISK